MICLEHATEEELLREVDKRIELGKIKWNNEYLYDSDTGVFNIKNEREPIFKIQFRSKVGIDTCYLLRKTWQLYGEPMEKKKQEQKERDEYEASKNTFDQICETLEAKIKKDIHAKKKL
ncbi:MAG: hypothetical protein MRERV_16c011 [Mycoplasmataceae bacterium RV_VA103A]|nr:MAG: hypothetical protein MRERV_16c011 [Mycoplasmataceae bacterium RV_VA103A]